VIVENRTGAAGNIAAVFVAHAAADGCTLLLTANHHYLNTLVYSKPGYAPGDFSPVVNVAAVPQVLAAGGKQPYTSFKGFLEHARSRPGKLSYASSGVGGPAHVGMELIKQATGTHILHVPYRGGVPSVAAIMTGEVELTIASVTAVQPYAADGRARALAIISTKRSALFPDVPTLAEAGYPESAYLVWNGLLAPAKTPGAVREQINEDVRAILQEPAVRDRLAKMGMEPIDGSMSDFEAFLKRDEKTNRRAVESLKLKLD
jgi:tripartite-type tricarboxylate transporter receptor subunit TctC